MSPPLIVPVIFGEMMDKMAKIDPRLQASAAPMTRRVLRPMTLVLTVGDLARAIAFYHEALGFEAVGADKPRTAPQRGDCRRHGSARGVDRRVA